MMRASRAKAGRSEEVCEALARADFYPSRPPRVEVRETHISWVFLAGDRAYKLKKPLRLPFVDYGTPRRRRRMCREEVRLNGRLAPDVYLGVRAVAETGAGLGLADEKDPRAVDYVVEMRRYDERGTVAAKLRSGELRLEQVADVGRLLASFHERARRVQTAGVAALAVERRMTENFHELLAITDRRSEIERVLALERFAHVFAIANSALLEGRGRGGRIREGHGDLRAEHVLIGPPLQVVDCLEFDAALRELDVADDLAFLVMDLAALGGERFARELVRAYRDAGGDPGDDRLIAFYAMYRALVRAKVELVRATETPPTSSRHGHESAAARELLSLAERFTWRARLPLVMVVCGVPATGKSTLARAIAELSGLSHLSSDLLRKRLVGVQPGGPAGEAAYTDEVNRQTYVRLGRRAAAEVVEHGGAIVDATFRHRADRDAFAVGFADAAPVLFTECRAPRCVLADRAARRDRRPGRLSDATLEVVMRESQVWEPLDEVPREAHVALRTDCPLEAQLDDLVALLDLRLEWLARRGDAGE